MKRTLILAAILLLPLTGCSQTDELRVGAGDTSGTYFAYGTELAKSIKKSDSSLNLKICETAGSVANIRLIEGDYLQLAFVQSDMLWSAYNGTGCFKEKHTGFSAVAGLYTEACQIVVPASSEIKSISDLYGKRISLGKEESGVLQNALQILFAYGIDESMIEAEYLSFTDSAAALKTGEIDAFFCTAGTPTPAISELSKELPVRLLPIGKEQADRIAKEYDGYISDTVKAGTYTGVGEDVATLGVKNVLIASNSLPAETVKKLTADVLEHVGDVKSKVSLEYATSDIPAGFHTGAVQYYREKGIEVPENTSRPAQKKYTSAESE